MKKKIRINFTDLWTPFDKKNNWFTEILSELYDVEISDYPDFLIYSVFGSNHYRYSCTKIFFSGENIAPDFSNCNYSLSFDWIDDPRHYRLPLYVLDSEYYNLILPKQISSDLLNRKFCNFIVSNSACEIRNHFYSELSKYKPIDSGGRFWNNIGYPVDNKLEFQSQYKFSIAFENNAYRDTRFGYTTEKIVDAMKAMTIPIYWGNEWVDRDFNTQSFVNFHDSSSMEEVIQRVIELDQNDDLYLQTLSLPWLVDNRIPESNLRENIKAHLQTIFG